MEDSKSVAAAEALLAALGQKVFPVHTELQDTLTIELAIQLFDLQWPTCMIGSRDTAGGQGRSNLVMY